RKSRKTLISASSFQALLVSTLPPGGIHTWNKLHRFFLRWSAKRRPPGSWRFQFRPCADADAKDAARASSVWSAVADMSYGLLSTSSQRILQELTKPRLPDGWRKS